MDGIVLQMFDKDISFDDVIASARTLKVTEADLAKGRIDWFNWDSVQSIRFDKLLIGRVRLPCLKESRRMVASAR